MPEFVSNEEIVLAARKRLRQGDWDYLVGASESETTMRRNRLAFDRWAIQTLWTPPLIEGLRHRADVGYGPFLATAVYKSSRAGSGT